jgi:hypothetical protein
MSGHASVVALTTQTGQTRIDPAHRRRRTAIAHFFAASAHVAARVHRVCGIRSEEPEFVSAGAENDTVLDDRCRERSLLRADERFFADELAQADEGDGHLPSVREQILRESHVPFT